MVQQPAGPKPAWLTYRTADDLFGSDPPPAWRRERRRRQPCDPSRGRVFQMLTKSGTVFTNNDMNEAFSYPLIDQNKNYAYYDVQFNQVQYEWIRDNQLYLIAKLAAAEPVQLPESVPGGKPPDSDGSTMVKTAWRQLTAADQKDRYFHIEAQLVVPSDEGDGPGDGITYSCVPATMGLVGIHIVRKINGNRPWIWLTFEQVDNIELPPHAPAGNPDLLQQRYRHAEDQGGWANRPPVKAPQDAAEGRAGAGAGDALQPDGPHAGQLQHLWLKRRLPGGAGRHRDAVAVYKPVATQWPRRAEPVHPQGGRRHLPAGLRRRLPGRRRGQHLG